MAEANTHQSGAGRQRQSDGDPSATEAAQSQLEASGHGSDDGAERENVMEDKEFDPVACLFCSEASEGLAFNVEHMRKKHGLFIPMENLVVDLETLLAYMHLVIYGYHECLKCGMERSSSEAVRQHMIGKGHCSIDLLDPDSEYRDFYQSDLEEDDEKEEGDSDEDDDMGTETDQRTSTKPLVHLLDGTARLQSGKLLAHRSARSARPANRKPLPPRNQQTIEFETTASAPGSSDTPEPSAEGMPPSALTRAERRGGFTTSRQPTTLRAEDRRSLLHLTPAEQRAALATQRKEVAKARRANYAMRGRVETLGNKTLMKTFRPDNPGGRTNG
jgi:pre-60S factor REI1